MPSPHCYRGNCVAMTCPPVLQRHYKRAPHCLHIHISALQPCPVPLSLKHKEEDDVGSAPVPGSGAPHSDGLGSTHTQNAGPERLAPRSHSVAYRPHPDYQGGIKTTARKKKKTSPAAAAVYFQKLMAPRSRFPISQAGGLLELPGPYSSQKQHSRV